ncbi:hypothetical protein ACVIIW_003612 [Bradyrhizobium sp. USDA 4449]
MTLILDESRMRCGRIPGDMGLNDKRMALRWILPSFGPPELRWRKRDEDSKRVAFEQAPNGLSYKTVCGGLKVPRLAGKFM